MKKIKYVECIPITKYVRILHSCQVPLPSMLMRNTEMLEKILEKKLRRKTYHN